MTPTKDVAERKDILDSCFSVTLNANDTFGFACADAHTVELCGIIVLKHIYAKFGQDGITALMAHERGYHPLKELRTPEYFLARTEIKKFLKCNPITKYYKQELARRSK